MLSQNALLHLIEPKTENSNESFYMSLAVNRDGRRDLEKHAKLQNCKSSAINSSDNLSIDSREENEEKKVVEKYQLVPAYRIPYGNTSTYEGMNWTDSETMTHLEFRRTVSESEGKTAINLLHVLDHVFHLHGIEWCLMYGTLAGQLYFHSLIPWDDDWDVVVFATEKRVKKVLDRFVRANPQFGFYAVNRFFSKFYRSDSRFAGSKKWRWPFVDIFYARLFMGRVYSCNEKLGTKADFFPLRRGFFGGLLLPIPAKAEKVIEVYYKHEFGKICRAGGYDHRNERFSTAHQIECGKLAGQYAWVERTTVWSGKERSSETVPGSFAEIDAKWQSKSGKTFRKTTIEALVRNGKTYHRVEIGKNIGGEDLFVVLRYC